MGLTFRSLIWGLCGYVMLTGGRPRKRRFLNLIEFYKKTLIAYIDMASYN